MATDISCVPRVTGVIKIIQMEGRNSSRNGRTKLQKRRGIKKEDTGGSGAQHPKIYSEKNEGTTDFEEVCFAVRVNFLSLLEWQR